MAKLKIDRGTTYAIDFYYKKSGVATTLVGATVRFTIKNEEYDSDTTDTQAEVTKDITTGDANGYAQITIDPSDTSTLEPGKYYYDIKVDEASDASIVYKVDEGTIILDGSPTNRLA